MPIRGLFEAHLTVSDIGRAVAFYRDVVGLEVAFEAPDRGAAFLWVGAPGDGLLGLWSVGSAPMGLVLHVAFAVSPPDLLDACRRLSSQGVAPLSFSGAETTEPSVIAWMPAAAVYFRDPDGHLLEYLAMLDEAPRPELGIVPWSRWADDAAARDPTDTAMPVHVGEYDGPRTALRPLFELAEDSASQLDASLGLGRVLVARQGEEIVGHLQLIAATDAATAEIRSMAVRAAHRRRGIGRTLIASAADLARDGSHHRLRVATAAADLDNLRFYQRVGFRLLGVERDAFTAANGYHDDLVVDGIPLRDRVWLDLELRGEPQPPRA